MQGDNAAADRPCAAWCIPLARKARLSPLKGGRSLFVSAEPVADGPDCGDPGGSFLAEFGAEAADVDINGA